LKIAIASGKGGTGKTSLATNLVAYLAENEEVVLIDLDVEEPNSGLFIKGELIHSEDKFKMIPQWEESSCSLCGLCQKTCRFNAIIQLASDIIIFPELCHSCYACSELCPSSSLPMIKEKMGELKHYKKNNISFIESRLLIGQEQAVPLISQTHDYIDQHFPNGILKFYDSPPGTSCPVIEATKEVDFVILVTEPTPFGLHDLRLAIETMKVLKKDFGVIINREGIGNNDVLDYCKNENIPVLAKIKNNRKIAELYSVGKLFYKEIPEVEEQLKEIKNYIFAKQKERRA